MAAAASLRPAAQYVRMSTDHQQYSIANQSAAIAAYAARHGYEIVRTYADAGVSGLSIARRTGLQALLADVVAGAPDFQTVLVYDISRWGRFQNPDEAAHYEFLCAAAGARVEYCAETFANDGSVMSTVFKSIRRAMAAEFSRDLSVKVSAGRRRLYGLGYWQGGTAGYGLRRMMLSEDGARRLVLQFGEGKAVVDCRSILVPGPAHEVAIVARIYRELISGVTVTAIARQLNAEGVPSEQGRPWSYHVVLQILTNSKYVGELVGGRRHQPLGGRCVKTHPSTWIRRAGAFEPIISRRTFAAAQAVLARRRFVKLSRAEMLEGARRLHAQHGRLTFELFDQDPTLPGSAAYRSRFGKLDDLLTAIGHPPAKRRRPRLGLSDEEALARLAALHRREGHLSYALIEAEPGLPGADTFRRRFGSLEQAFAQIGYVQLSRSERASPVGRARIAAAYARVKALADAADAAAAADARRDAPD